MKIVWICKRCGKIEEIDVLSPYTNARLPSKHGFVPPCVHDWYPVEIRRGI